MKNGNTAETEAGILQVTTPAAGNAVLELVRFFGQWNRADHFLRLRRAVARVTQGWSGVWLPDNFAQFVQLEVFHNNNDDYHYRVSKR